MRYLVRDGGNIDGYGPWQKVACASQSEATTEKDFFKDGDAPYEPRVTASGDNQTFFNSADVASRVQGILATPAVTNLSNQALDAVGITDPAQRGAFRSLISQESVNCKNEISPAGAYGCAQLLIGTARDMDRRLANRFAGLSDAQVRQILINDDAYNIMLGAAYFKEGLRRTGGNITLTLARYNGGDKAIEASTICPGQLSYQCTTNTKYQQTRNYVNNINAVNLTLAKNCNEVVQAANAANYDELQRCKAAGYKEPQFQKSTTGG